MTQVITLISRDLGGTVSQRTQAGGRSRDAFQSLTDRQQQFVKQYAWRAEHNWYTGETELTIRKKQFSSREWTEILFLFPHAQLRKGAIR